MRKIVLTTIALLLLLSSFQLTIPATNITNTLSLTEKIDLSEPTITSSDGFSMVSLPDSQSFLQKPGKPLIPTITKIYFLPFNTKISSVTIQLSDSHIYHINHPLQPASEPMPLNNILSPTISMDSTIYTASDTYPKTDFDIQIGSGLQKNHHVTILTITCYPLKYHPQDNYIELSKTIEIQIEYEPPSQPKMPLSNSNDLTIITTQEFSTKLQPLIDHKNSVGITTQLTVDTEIYNQFPGRDQEEQIKYYIKDLIETQGTTYLLIVGGVLHIPMRYTAINVWNENYIPTDLYYADIFDSQGNFCTWDSNHNDLFGEFDWDLGPIDQVDLYPDIHIGRLPCTTTEEVEIMVQKIITYETSTHINNWFDKIIYIAGDTFPFHGNIEGEFVTSKIIEQRPEFTPIRIWTSQGNYNPLTINREITKGAGFVSYSGHGYEQGFGTSKPDVEKRIEYYSPYLIGLFNTNKFPVVFFDACSTTKLDFDMEGFEEWYPVMSALIKLLEGNNYNPDEHFPCFSWQIMKKPTTGAIATIGATRVAFTHVNGGGVHGGAGYLNLHFFMAYEPEISVAEMMTSAQNDYISYVGMDCVTLEEFILLGDPSLRMGGY